MTKLVTKSLKLGGSIGFTSAILYGIFSLIIAELYLPHPNPVHIAIFDESFYKFLLPKAIIPSSPFWLFAPAVCGAFVAGSFSTHLEKSKLSSKLFIYYSAIWSTLIASPILVYFIFKLINILFLGNLPNHPFTTPLMDIFLMIGFPLIVYFIAVTIVCNKIYKYYIAQR
jgi:hypothetical protein